MINWFIFWYLLAIIILPYGMICQINITFIMMIIITGFIWFWFEGMTFGTMKSFNQTTRQSLHSKQRD